MVSVDEVWELLRRGERKAAQVASLQLLDATPEDPSAWSLAAEVADEAAWQAECWREVLRLRPESRVARRRLASLEGASPEPTERDREALQDAILRARGEGQRRRESPASSQAKVREVERRMLLRETSEQQAMRVIQLAGGPLPVEERRKCPHCEATISRRAPRCEWCGRPV